MRQVAVSERVTAYIGLGANLGDTRAALRSALEALAALPDTVLVAVSSAYRSAPVDAAGPDFLNAVARIETALPAARLLVALHEIEQRHHRERPYRNAPRTLDLDLLLYGDACSDDPALSLPHPRLHLRAFVLLPLLELDPGLSVAGLGPLAGWLPGVAEQAIERDAQPLCGR
jgi:2-amino-4-hydroxy-6-hydroxymethyldihydropteridine diphosphokinase